MKSVKRKGLRFHPVKFDPEIRTLVWPNDADFDPVDLHDWPEIEQDFIRHAQRWEAT
jgi:hypothetical protein